MKDTNDSRSDEAAGMNHTSEIAGRRSGGDADKRRPANQGLAEQQDYALQQGRKRTPRQDKHAPAISIGTNQS